MKKAIELLEKELEIVKELSIKSIEKWINSNLKDDVAFNDIMYFEAQKMLLYRLIKQFKDELL